jgi:hypothetical protein
MNTDYISMIPESYRNEKPSGLSSKGFTIIYITPRHIYHNLAVYGR